MPKTRKPVSKKIRFEVFKRDSFTCQFCGQSAPNAVLELDHIDPVAKGGTNDILNLITSCTDCNRGKSDRMLSDHSAIQKRKRQLDLLQERREQIEAMFQWSVELQNHSEILQGMVTNYIEAKIKPHTLSISAKSQLAKLVKSNDLPDLMEAIDTSAETYLRYDKNDQVTQDSVELCVQKIGGILSIKKKPPIKQKISHIVATGNQQIPYWNKPTAFAVLDQYISALKDNEWDDERILADLESEVMPITRNAKSWSSWRSTIESWTQELSDSQSEDDELSDDYEGLDEFDIDSSIDGLIRDRLTLIEGLAHIGKEFDRFDLNRLIECIDGATENYIQTLQKSFEDGSSELNFENFEDYYRHFARKNGLWVLLGPIDSVLKMSLSEAADLMIKQYFKELSEIRANGPDFPFENYLYRFHQVLEAPEKKNPLQATERTPLGLWYCDVCGNLIEPPQKAYIIWKSEGKVAKDFKIIHQNQCDLHDHNASIPLDNLLGLDGLTYLLAFLSVGPIHSNSTTTREPQIENFDAYVDLVRRVQIPYYEQARRRFRDRRIMENFYGSNEAATYRVQSLERMTFDFQNDD